MTRALYAAQEPLPRDGAQGARGVHVSLFGRGNPGSSHARLRWRGGAPNGPPASPTRRVPADVGDKGIFLALLAIGVTFLALAGFLSESFGQLMPWAFDGSDVATDVTSGLPSHR